MVDALREANRVLISGGMLIDIRPVGELSPLEVAVDDVPVAAGELDTTGLIADDQAADAAVEHALRSGWFVYVASNRFTIEFQWSGVADFEAYVFGGRQPKRARPSSEELMRAAGKHAQVRNERTTILGVYRKSAPV